MSTVFGYHDIHLRDYFYVLRKRKRLIALSFLLCLFFGFASIKWEKTLYRATATILIERENPNVVDFKEVMSLDASSTDYYQTQYQMLKSRSLIQALIEKEDLQNDPYLKSLMRGGLRYFLGRWLREFATPPSPEDVFIRKMLRIDPVRNSRLVEVGVLHPDPEKASEIANQLIDLFIQRNLESRYLVSKQATDLLSKQLVELKDKVSAAERKLQHYKEEHKLVSIPSIREKNEFLQEAKLELVKLQAEESKLAKRYLPDHPKRIHLRSQIEGLTGKIQEEEKKILERSGTAIDYAELEREDESSRQIYEALLARLQQTSSEAKTQASNIIVVDRAPPPVRPYSPKPLMNILIALFIGIAGGISLAFFVEYLDSTVKIPDDIEKGLGLDLMGIIPKGEKNRKGEGVVFFSSDEPSPAFESFRALRTALLFRLRRFAGSRVVLVTSPNPEEGKSTVVLNLGVAFQQNHLRVILMDADLRKPRLHKIFDVPSENGLSDVLEGTVSLEKAIYKNVPEFGFDFLSCGTRSSHPTEILGSQEMKKLLDSLKQIYDIVLLDSPPYLAVADVAVLSEYASAMLFVARYQKTEKRHLKNIVRRFSLPESSVLGVVINQVSVRERDYYYHQYYYYGYGDAAPPQ